MSISNKTQPLSSNGQPITERTTESRHLQMNNWRGIGWDGIVLKIPVDWHPATIYKNYLLFEDQYQPIFALKWQRIKGRFEAERILNKLQKSLGQSELTPWITPASWNTQLKPFLHQGFHWQGQANGGIGLLLYCSTTQRALLLQFYQEENKAEILGALLLANLQTQQKSSLQLWSMFDISIRLNPEAKLSKHSFLPGSFRLQFQLNDLELTYYRLKPAAELLRHKSLSDLGKSLAGNALLQAQGREDSALWRRDPNKLYSLLARLRRKPAASKTRLWHIPERNVILGLKVGSNKPLSDQRFDALCNEYTPC